MKKWNIILAVTGVIAMCFSLLAIFQGYYRQSVKAFHQLMYENQRAYTASQKTEAMEKVETLRNAISMAAAALEGCSSEEEFSEYDYIMDLTDNMENFQKGGVSYYSFAGINKVQMDENDLELIARLKKGEEVISHIYTSEEDGLYYFGIAKPVFLDGSCVGFVRGLVSTDILMTSSQTGFLRDQSECYLMHQNGDNALMDGNEKQFNMYDILRKICDKPDAVNALEKKMKQGEETAAAQAMSEGETIFISYAVLPYNDWVILNVTNSDVVKGYIGAITKGGRNFTILVVCAAALVMLLLLWLYWRDSRGQRFERKRTELLVNFTDTVVCEYDMAKDRMKCTSNTTKLLAIPETAMDHFSQYMEKEELVYPGDSKEIKKLDLPKEGEVIGRELRLKNHEGIYSWFHVHMTYLAVKGKQKGHLIIKITDIQESKKTVQNLVDKAERDALTGLLNREAFRLRVQEHLNRGEGGCMFLMDLDHFKKVNDKYGHQAGDRLLQIAAECMEKCFREGECLGRYGGDEFLAFIPGPIPERAATGRAEILAGMIRESRTDEMPGISFTVSIGVTRYEGGAYENFIEKADMAMYDAKKAGGNTWLFR